MEASKDLIIFNLSQALTRVMARFKPEVGDDASAADQLMWTQCELVLSQARGNEPPVPIQQLRPMAGWHGCFTSMNGHR